MTPNAAPRRAYCSWVMVAQHGARCEWECRTEGHFCRKTTYDGKGAAK